MSAYQIPLQIKLNDAATLENYLAADNAALLTILAAETESYLYWWSSEAAGKTHLLQALCHQVGHGKSIYLPLKDVIALQPAIFEDLEQYALVCLDDLQYLAGKPDWELALFNLYNRMRERGTRLCISANSPPNQIGVQLADLLSRLNWGVVYQLQPLTDQQKKTALQLRATRRGFNLPDDVANYLLTRFPRDLHNLFALLDKLDEATLQAQRRLTIPFVKQQLSSG